MTIEMSGASQIQGELQAQIMAALWKIENGTVEEVRGALPPRYRSAYTTVQTVLNRLTVRGLLSRSKTKNQYVYKPEMSEAEYVANSVEATLASASPQARDAVMAMLIGKLPENAVNELQDRASEIDRRREAGGK